MKLIDTHSHIYSNEFDNDKKALFENALQWGVNKILMPAIDTGTHEKMLQLEKEHPENYVSMMGIHPCSVNENYLNEIKAARAYFDQRKFIAVGETGLDFYWDKTFTDQQYIAFRTQIEWALEFDIPVVIHSRSSTDECIAVIKEFQNGNLKGVFHCFSGDITQAKEIIDLGFYLGIGGVLTFKNSGVDKIIEELDLNNIVLETDAPYLAPVPFRGKRNEPSYLRYVAEKISTIKNIPMDEVAAITTANAEKLFAL